MRLVALPPKADGSVRAVLEIEPLPGWKTYWRAPGASGMAPELDFNASDNLVVEHIDFPVPDAIGSGQAGFIGYRHPIGLSLAFKQPRLGEKSILEGNVLVGLCDQICIPFSSRFSLTLDPADKVLPDELSAVGLADASLAQKPGADFHITSAELATDGKTIAVSLQLPQNVSPEIFVAPARGFVIGPPQDGALKDHRFTFRLQVKRIPKGKSLRLEDVILLVKSGGRAIEIPLVPQ